MGLKNRGDMNDVGVHDLAVALPGPASFRGDLCPDGVSISGVDARGVAGMDISSVSGLSSIMWFNLVLGFCFTAQCSLVTTDE